MDMLDPKTRRKKILKRAFLYTLMTGSVIVLVIVGLFSVLGFTVDEDTGQAKQGGLMQFRSVPEAATVVLDRKTLTDKTPSKSNVSSDSTHDVTIKKALYREWRKASSVRTGELVWLNALLVPRELKTSEVFAFSELAQIVPSPDKKWLLALEKNTEPVMKLVDIRDEKKPRVTPFSLPTSLIIDPKPTDTYELAEWDFGTRYILLKRSTEGQVVWYRLDRTDSNAVRNLTTVSGINLSDVHFTGTSGSIFYGLNEGAIRKVNINQKTISDPIGHNVESYMLYKENWLVYKEKTPIKQRILFKKDDAKPISILQTTDVALPLKVTQAEYFNDTYIVMTKGNFIEIIQNPEARKNIYFKATLPFVPEWVYFSNNGQFVVAQTGHQLFTYNLERKESFRFSFSQSTTPYNRPTPLKWLDDFRLWSDQDGKLTMIDFDGTNEQPLSTVLPGYGVTLSSNNKQLFSIGQNAVTKKSVLQSSRMILE